MTAEARKNWNLEAVWNRVAKESGRVTIENEEMEESEAAYEDGEEFDSMVAMDGLDEVEMDKLDRDGLADDIYEKKV